MINSILLASNEYLNSSEYEKAFDSICNQFSLNEDSAGYLNSTLMNIVSGSIDENDFVEYLQNLSNIKLSEIDELFKRSKELIFTPFKTKVAKMVMDKQQEAFNEPAALVVRPISIPDKLLRADAPPVQEDEELIHFVPQQPIPTSRPIEPMTKDHILSQIENPPRTVVDKYVIEQEGITDPNHLIDDTVEQRARLEAHYND